MTYTVVVDDNFHYMDEGERREIGKYPTAQQAIDAAQKIVNDYLASAYRTGMSAKDLYDSYTSFGEDPFIVCSDGPKVAFSAWTYAKQRCNEICGGGLGSTSFS